MGGLGGAGHLLKKILRLIRLQRMTGLVADLCSRLYVVLIVGWQIPLLLREVSGPVLFFSSRRRHTRCLSDWSSDVCSSDLQPVIEPGLEYVIAVIRAGVGA